MTDSLIALPHTLLRVPPDAPRVTRLRITPAGGYDTFAAQLTLGGRAVGTIRGNESGEITLQPRIGTGPGQAELFAALAACRTPDGGEVADKLLLHLLVQEHRTGLAIDEANRAGQGLTRHVIEVDRLILTRTTVPTSPLHDQNRRAGMAHALAATTNDLPDLWWQWWDGTAWADLTPHRTTSTRVGTEVSRWPS